MAEAPPSTRPPSRRRLRRLAWALLALLVTLGAAEGLLRLSARFSPRPPLWVGDREPQPMPARLGVSDPDLGWRLGPHQVRADPRPELGGLVYRANLQGFRSAADFELPPPTGTRRIVFVGDSFTFGLGVELEHTFAELVAANLGRVESCNLGLPGFGVDQMLRALELHGLPLQPDLVVAAFIDPDLERCQEAYRDRGVPVAKPTFVLEGGELRPMRLSDRPAAPLRWLQRESRLVELARRLERRLARSFGVGGRWRLARALFERMHASCERTGVPLVVVRLPLRGRPSPAPGFARDFERLGVTYLDLEADIDPARDGELFQPDGHISAAGHAAVAERLAEFLRARPPFGEAR